MKNLLFILIACLLMSCIKPLDVNCIKHQSCKNDCQKQFSLCMQSCENSCAHCQIKSIRSTINSDSKYKREQRIQGGIIVNQLKSFNDPLQCRITTCDCLADYSVCRQAKSGIIHKSLQIDSACER